MNQHHLEGPSQRSDVAIVRYQANAKSTALAYVLWFFLGGLGIHRFYLNRTGSGVAMLLLFIFGWATVAFVVGLFLLIPLGIWLFVDLFLIPGMVSQHNNALVDKLEWRR